MAITIHIKFESLESVTGQTVKWVFRNRNEEVVKKGATQVGANNLLILPDIPIGEKEILTLTYLILGKSRSLNVQHTAKTLKEGLPLEIKNQTVTKKTMIISFMGYKEEVDESLKKKPVKWSYKINPKGDLKTDTTPTDEFGRLTITGWDVLGSEDTDEPKPVSLSQEITYKIENINGPFKIIEDKIGGNDLFGIENATEVRIPKPIVTRVEINHIGGNVVEGTLIDWTLHNMKRPPLRMPPPKSAKASAIPQQSTPLPQTPVLPQDEIGELIASGQTAIEDRKLIFPQFKIFPQNPPTFILVYTIDGKAQNIKLKVDTVGLISETVFLENTTIFIDFKGTLIPTIKQNVKWFLKNAKGVEVKTQDEKSGATDENGRLTISDVKFSLQDVLTFEYLISGKGGSIEIKHDDESKTGKPLRVVELLEGPTVEIQFIGDLISTANLPVKWTIKNSGNTEVVTEKPRPEATDGAGKLIIKQVDLPGKQTSDTTFHILEYAIFNKSGKINLRNNEESREGKPLLITRYLEKIPIHIDFVDAINKDSNGKDIPLPGEAVNWRLKGENNIELRPVQPLSNQTNEKGRLTIFKGFDVMDKNLTFEYEIRGQRGSIVIEEQKDEGWPIVRKIPVGRRVTIKNPQRFWLTYETRFNWAPYSKTNQKVDIHLYRMDINKILLILDPRIDQEELEALRKVFFPKLSKEQLREFGMPPWAGERKRFNVSPVLQVAKRHENKEYVGYAVLPYNTRDNSANSKAIGTETKSNHKAADEAAEQSEKKDAEAETKCCEKNHDSNLVPLQATLDMWNTASRSSIVFVKELEEDFELNIAKPEKAPLQDQMVLPEKQIVEPEPPKNKKMWLTYGELSCTRFLNPKPDAGTQFNDVFKNIFSIKSGVNLIGFAEQSGKAKLEHNSILAALRSAYIRDIETRFSYKIYDDPTLLVLTEIMTVTEASPHWDDWVAWKKDNMGGACPQPQFGDGYQIRSLKGMKPAPTQYFPPICIPFVIVKDGKVDAESTCDMSYKIEGKILREWTDEAMPKSLSVFPQIADLEWQKFWKKHYVEALGRTKARLLLEYGLQGFGGNAQNFLLEMQDGVPNGRVVVRDMGDYALHDFVLWALFKQPSDKVPDPRGKGPGGQEEEVKAWQKAFTKGEYPLLDFECRVLHEYRHDWKSMENPGVQSEFPTFTGYHRFQKSGMHTRNPFCQCCDKSDAPFVGHISPLWAYALPVSPQIIDRMYTDISAATWAKIFEVETAWGIAHARAWLKFIEAALGINFAVDWKPKPAAELKENRKDWFKSPIPEQVYHIHDPRDYHTYAGELLIKGEDIYSSGGQKGGFRERFLEIKKVWTELYDNMKLWEMYLGWQVENHLKTEEGQMALQRYLKDRKFRRTIFTLQVLDEADKPVEDFAIKLIRRDIDKEWTDVTDSNGEIRVYEKDAEVYNFVPQGMESGFIAIKNLIAEHKYTEVFNKYKIKFAHG